MRMTRVTESRLLCATELHPLRIKADGRAATAQVPWETLAHIDVVGEAMNVMQELLIDAVGYLHDLEEFAVSGYFDAVPIVRVDQFLVVCMCSLIVRFRKTRTAEPEPDLNLAFCETFLLSDFSEARPDSWASQKTNIKTS